MRKIKVGDLVKIIAGNFKGIEGLVVKMDLQKKRLSVEGVKKVITYVKKGTYSTEKEGYSLEKDRMIDWSNVMLIDPKTKKITRTSVLVEGKKRTRVTKSGFKIDWEKRDVKNDNSKKENVNKTKTDK